MGKAVHRMLSVDKDTLSGVCAMCGPVRVKRKQGKRPDVPRYLCAVSQARWNGGNRTYIAHKGTECSRCGFVPEHPCQLDVHHKDHDRHNDVLENLTTLCANCHRLEHAPLAGLSLS